MKACKKCKGCQCGASGVLPAAPLSAPARIPEAPPLPDFFLSKKDPPAPPPRKSRIPPAPPIDGFLESSLFASRSFEKIEEIPEAPPLPEAWKATVGRRQVTEDPSFSDYLRNRIPKAPPLPDHFRPKKIPQAPPLPEAWKVLKKPSIPEVPLPMCARMRPASDFFSYIKTPMHSKDSAKEVPMDISSDVEEDEAWENFKKSSIPEAPPLPDYLCRKRIPQAPPLLEAWKVSKKPSIPEVPLPMCARMRPASDFFSYIKTPMHSKDRAKEVPMEISSDVEEDEAWENFKKSPIPEAPPLPDFLHPKKIPQDLPLPDFWRSSTPVPKVPFYFKDSQAEDSCANQNINSRFASSAKSFWSQNNVEDSFSDKEVEDEDWFSADDGSSVQDQETFFVESQKRGHDFSDKESDQDQDNFNNDVFFGESKDRDYSDEGSWNHSEIPAWNFDDSFDDSDENAFDINWTNLFYDSDNSERSYLPIPKNDSFESENDDQADLSYEAHSEAVDKEGDDDFGYQSNSSYDSSESEPETEPDKVDLVCDEVGSLSEDKEFELICDVAEMIKTAMNPNAGQLEFDVSTLKRLVDYATNQQDDLVAFVTMVTTATELLLEEEGLEDMIDENFADIVELAIANMVDDYLEGEYEESDGSSSESNSDEEVSKEDSFNRSDDLKDYEARCFSSFVSEVSDHTVRSESKSQKYETPKEEMNYSDSEVEDQGEENVDDKIDEDLRQLKDSAKDLVSNICKDGKAVFRSLKNLIVHLLED
ncbi:hypothetical protein L596_022648 [Steinernema carpocapsae]|uniref:Uncharacterized protein n=1 Tax=Steinernema carpocapsae TaxID=34508 RepID=A0A4U5MM95_STECR|nr:hypothetical protein L596_022648 [Steinernema carpocapsae]